jgi:hypothetical protein
LLRRIDAPFGVALLFSLLIPLVQVSLHLAARSDLFAAGKGPQTGIGALYNLPDTLSYASWATQAKLGYITFSDLFTTEPHSRALFNLYFLAVGFLTRVIGTDALSVMEFSSLLLGPLSVFAVLMVVRELKFNPMTQALSLVLVFLGSGISGLMIMLDTRGLHLLSPGADAHYLDLFPLSSLVFYPYHAATFVLLAVIVMLSTRLLAMDGGPSPARLAALLGALFLLTGLVRPYEAVTLLVVFNLAALVGLVVGRGAHLGKTIAVCLIVDVLALPPIAYAAFMTTQPVWRSFADNSMAFETGGSGFFFKGFAILWTLASVGLYFAIIDGKRLLTVVSCWAIVGAALLLLSPSYGSKFAGGSVLPNALLGAYGVQRLLEKSRLFRPLVVGAVGVMCLTPIVAFADILQVGAPQIDAELLIVGKRIRELEGTRLPVLLTEANAGAVLVALFGHRVYAGHWSLTLGYLSKVEQLKRAGVDASSPAASGYDRALLTELIRDSGANYLLLRRTAPAMEAVAACSHSKPLFEGDRWLAVGTSGWSCP